MNINELIAIVKNKLEAKIIMQNLKIEDKSFLHKNHKSNEDGRFHLKLSIKSDELAKFSLLENILNIKEFNLIENHLSKLNLPRNINKFFSIKNLDKILSFMKKDKKNNNKKISLVLLKRIGSPLYKMQFNEKKIIHFLKNELIK